MFQGKVAILTGAARGLGRAISLKFAEERCRLALVDINLQRLDVTGVNVRGY